MTLFITNQTMHLLELFFWMLGAFLIGYIFSWFYYKNKYESELTESTQTISELRDEMQSTIRAKKTVERGGIEIKQPKQLNLKAIGEASEDEKDDLTQIKGVGTFIETKLNSIGIYTYKQITNLTLEDIETVTDLIQFFPGRIVRDDWKGQAKKLLNKS
ncbi:hypothetical protein [uncultured Tenacibaculum sp.]|uniref:hypothetical protein n=1 Tax=uncultured Tenacibaculum sp. TaxID=174713 RepID=UPI002614069F|nr:hypothetical protein [uncultured Tenacibaculum sp.]